MKRCRSFNIAKARCVVICFVTLFVFGSDCSVDGDYDNYSNTSGGGCAGVPTGTFENLERSIPCYWANGVRIDLPYNNTHGRAYSLFAVGNRVYTCGWLYEEGINMPCYWIDTTWNNLSGSGGNSAMAREIFVYNGAVYTAGQYDAGLEGAACYWTNSQRSQLPTPTQYSSTATSIFVTDSKVYTSGVYRNDDDTGGVPCYWIGTSRTDLPYINSAGAQSIYVFEGTVYTGGFQYVTDYETVACYWIGTTRTDLTGKNGKAYAIFVSEGIVYIAGSYEDGGLTVPCYWTETLRTDLPCDHQGSVRSIYASNGKVFLGGSVHGLSLSNPCYWIENTRTDLVGDGIHDAYGSSIFVIGDTVYVAGSYLDGSRYSFYRE